MHAAGGGGGAAGAGARSRQRHAQEAHARREKREVKERVRKLEFGVDRRTMIVYTNFKRYIGFAGDRLILPSGPSMDSLAVQTHYILEKKKTNIVKRWAV